MKKRKYLFPALLWLIYTFLDSAVVYHDFYSNYFHAFFSSLVQTFLSVIAAIPIPFIVRKYPAYQLTVPKLLGVYVTYLVSATLFKVFSFHYFMAAIIPPASLDTVMTLNYFRFFYAFLLFISIVLIYTTIAYLKQFRQKELEAVELRRLTQEMQLSTLKSQLNPHFLFNALNSISSLASQSADLTRSAVQKLSQLLRILLKHSDSEFYSIEDELDFVRNYLELEHLRFQDKMKYEITIEPSIKLTSEIPILLLQPLIENSIKHGLKNKLADAEIKITISRENKLLKFSVTDNGAGLSVNPLEDERNHGIGLKNLKNRLQLLYGDSAKLNLKNGLNGGCSIEIELPEKAS